MFVFYFRIYCVWRTLSHNKSSVFLSRSGVVYFHPFWRQLPGVHFKYIKVWKLKNRIQNFDSMKEAWCTRYTQSMLSWPCCMFTENCYFNILWNAWDRNIIITVNSDNLNNAQSGDWTIFHSQNQDADQMVIWLLQLHIMSAGRLL